MRRVFRTCDRRFRFLAARRLRQAKNGKEGGGGGRRRKRLQANPAILKNPVVHERASQGI